MQSTDMHDSFRLALAWLRAIRANDTQLAGELLKQFQSPEHAVFGLTVLLGLLAEAVPNIDTILESLTTQTALEDGTDWLINPGSVLYVRTEKEKEA